MTASLSARRAWIEIASGTLSDTSDVVALRKESVDRNHIGNSATALPSMSLSARRAWIEIPSGCWRESRRASLSARRAWIEIHQLIHHPSTYRVALRKESVDRNHYDNYNLHCVEESLSARRAWIEIDEQIKQEFVPEGRSPQGERG